jgi:monoterpene epsilon-lactone hydrolase
MSLALRLLNPWLRKVEKRRLSRGTIGHLRRAFSIQARLLFHAPSGTVFSWKDYGGIACRVVMPRNCVAGRVIFYIHGGGFVFGSPDTHRAMAGQLARRTGACLVMPRYRLAPEAPFPAAPDDVRAAWNGLVSSGIAARDMVIGGDSAGAALAFGLISQMCAARSEMPGAVFGLSPLTDLTYSGESFARNALRDAVLAAERAPDLAALFLCGHRRDDPRVSPLFGCFEGAPPAWITVGDTEILLDDARRLAARLTVAGVQATLSVQSDHPHVWPLFHTILPEARQTLDDLGTWIRQQQGWAF